MPKLYSSKNIVATLERNGFFFVSQKGSHMKFHKDGSEKLTVIVPANRREIPYGTFKSILRQSKLIEDNFL